MNRFNKEGGDGDKIPQINNSEDRGVIKNRGKRIECYNNSVDENIETLQGFLDILESVKKDNGPDMNMNKEKELKIDIPACISTLEELMVEFEKVKTGEYHNIPSKIRETIEILDMQKMILRVKFHVEKIEEKEKKDLEKLLNKIEEFIKKIESMRYKK